jgi:hypothetical protein
VAGSILLFFYKKKRKQNKKSNKILLTTTACCGAVVKNECMDRFFIFKSLFKKKKTLFFWKGLKHTLKHSTFNNFI